jgi:hypothetical protein
MYLLLFTNAETYLAKSKPHIFYFTINGKHFKVPLHKSQVSYGRFRVVKSHFLIFIGIFLSGCSQEPRRLHPGVPSFKEPAVSVEVGVIKTEIPPQEINPHDVGALISPNPSQIVEQWLKERFNASGGKLTGTFVIQKASITEPQQSARLSKVPYKGKLDVLFKVTDENGKDRGSLQASASHTRTASQSLNLYERQQVWIEMVEQMINALDTQICPLLQEGLRLTIDPSSN